MIQLTVAAGSEIGTPGSTMYVHPDMVHAVEDDTIHRHIYIIGLDTSGNQTDLYVQESMDFIFRSMQPYLGIKGRTPDYGKGSRVPVNAPDAPGRGGSGGFDS